MNIKNEIKDGIWNLMNGILNKYQTINGISDGDSTQICEWDNLQDETVNKWDEMIRSVLSEQIRFNQ